MRNIIILSIALFLFSNEGIAQTRLVKTFHSNGVIKAEGNLVNGKKNGEWRTWGTDSILAKVQIYKDDYILSEVSYNSKGGVIKKIDGTLNKTYGLKSEYENGYLVRRNWVSQNKYGFNYGTSYKSYGSALRWKAENELSSWQYRTSQTSHSRYKSVTLPTVSFYEGNSLSNVRLGPTTYTFDKTGKIQSYKGPLDGSKDIYFCTFQTYDGKVKVRKNGKAVERDLSLKSFVGVAFFDVKNGMPNGTWKAKYPNGKKWFSMEFQKGFLNGTSTIYHSNGTKILEANFKAGHLNGSYREWHANGALSFDGQYVEGQMVNTWKGYNSEGELTQLFTIYENSFDGEWINNRPNGSPYIKRTYKKGVLDGATLEYNMTGQLISKQTYSGGEKIQEINYDKLGNIIFHYDTKGLKYRYHQNGRIREVIYSDDVNLISFSLDSNGKESQFHYNNTDDYSIFAMYKKDSIHRYIYKIAKEELNLFPYPFLKKWPKDVRLIEGDQNDLRNGPWKTYYPNGTLLSDGTYLNGKLNGILKVYSLEGTTIAELNYADGLLQGEVKIYNFKGELKKSETYTKHKLNGEQKSWFKDKNQVEQITNYKQGVREGKSISYAKNGNKFREYTYQKGKLNGESFFYYKENEAISNRVNYKNGKRDGILESFDINGNLLTKTEYKDGKKHGLYQQYDGAGSLLKQDSFEYGIFVEPKSSFIPCDCEAGDNKLSSAKFFPSVQTLVKWNEVLFYLDGKVQVENKVFERTFYNQLQNGGNRSSSARLNLINRRELSFKTIENPGVTFVLNPCLKEKEFSKINLFTKYNFPITNIMDEDYDPTTFKKTPRQYFDIAMTKANFTVRQMVQRYWTLNGYDELKSAKKMKAEMEKYSLAKGYDWEERDREKLIGLLAPEKEKFIELIFQEYFDVKTLDQANFPKEHRQFTQSLRNFFRDYNEVSSISGIDQLFKKQLYVELGNRQLGIDFPKQLLTPKNSISTMRDGERTSSSARLTMNIVSLSYGNDQGVSIKQPSNFCFTPSHFTGTKLSLEFSDAKLNFGETYYNPYNTPEIIKWSKSNKHIVSRNIIIPTANGKWSSPSSQKSFPIEYKNLYIEDDYMVGEITVTKSSSWTSLLQNEFSTGFSVFKVIENTNDSLKGYFIFEAKM